MIKFVRNYNDESTDTGFQFQFYCDRCGTGYESRFETFAGGMVGEAARGIGGMLGGIFGQAADVGERVRSAAWERARDGAFEKAVNEVKPVFRQCHRCGSWVCAEACWNEARGQCVDCSPKLEQEMAAAQSEATVEQMRQKVTATDYTKDLNVVGTAVALCPSCGAETKGGKFCQECGALLAAERQCSRCGTTMPAASKFCPECGLKIS